MFQSLFPVFVLCIVSNAMNSCPDGGIGPCVDGSCQAGATCLTTSSICCIDYTIRSVTTGPPCFDKLNPQTGFSDCSKMESYCNDHFYYDVMTEQCPRTCNRCNMIGTTIYPTTCADKINLRTGHSDCLAMRSYCTDSVYAKLMREQCPKTCGVC